MFSFIFLLFSLLSIEICEYIGAKTVLENLMIDKKQFTNLNKRNKAVLTDMAIFVFFDRREFCIDNHT